MKTAVIYPKYNLFCLPQVDCTEEAELCQSLGVSCSLVIFL